MKNTSVATVDRTGLVTVKGCGSMVIQIKAAARNNYKAAETTITLTVAPKNIKITSVKSKKPKTITVKWKKDKKASGYIIECATDKKFKKNKKTAVIKKNSVTTAKISKLKNGKKYYVRVCAYANGENGKILSTYTKFKKAVKTAAKKK